MHGALLTTIRHRHRALSQARSHVAGLLLVLLAAGWGAALALHWKQQETEIMNHTHQDRPRELERWLRCEQPGDQRKLCFAGLVHLLNGWPPGSERTEAFARAERELAGWAIEDREVHSERVIRSGEVLDTARLVQVIRDWYPEDTDRDSAHASRLARSAHAAAIDTLLAVRSHLAFSEWARGPGLARLRVLVMNDVFLPRKDLGALASWAGLATLEDLSLRDTYKIQDQEELWQALRKAPRLRALRFAALSSERPIPGILAAEPELCRRLTELELVGVYLQDRHLDALCENRALTSLRTLDLRKNHLTREAVARLRRCPQFARTQVLELEPLQSQSGRRGHHSFLVPPS